jgi:hypothetical protein
MKAEKVTTPYLEEKFLSAMFPERWRANIDALLFLFFSFFFFFFFFFCSRALFGHALVAPLAAHCLFVLFFCSVSCLFSSKATSHLNGMFYRTMRMMKHGIRPVWVFDGKPPVLKGGELAKRRKAKKEAKEKLEEAAEVGDQVEVAKAVKVKNEMTFCWMQKV